MPQRHQSEQAVTVEDLARHLKLRLQGDESRLVHGVASFAAAARNDLCFIKESRYLEQLRQSHCGTVIVPKDFEHQPEGKVLLFSDNPHLSFVQAIDYLGLSQGNWVRDSIHPSALIADSAFIGDGVSIGAHCVIGERVVLEKGVLLGAGCIIENDVTIGAHSRLLARVTVCYDCRIGAYAILQPGVVIGGDGFGLVYDQGQWVKIPHLGKVVLGERVEIGANTTLDRGALDDTVIENGVKLDNLIQIGHNVHIGENTAVAACAAIAGSVTIGGNCKISGAVAIAGHLSICDDVTVTGMTVVSKSIKSPGVYSSGTPMMDNRDWHRNNARFKNLDKMAKTLSELEKKSNLR